jgi:hypothetical protein
MSGGAFQYAFTRVQQFADDVRERIAEHPKSFSGAEVERLRLLAEHCGVVADWMKAAEWLASGDTDEDVFLRDTQGLARIAAVAPAAATQTQRRSDMKPMLTKAAPHPLYYYRSGMWIGGPHPGLQGNIHPELRGNVSSLWGNVHPELRGDATGLWGDVHPELRGDVSGLRGEVTGLWGDATGLWGNLDACGITDAEREAGVDVATLVRSEP